MAEILLGGFFLLIVLVSGGLAIMALPWASEFNVSKGMVLTATVICVVCFGIVGLMFFGG